MSYATKPLALDETLVRVAETLEGGTNLVRERFINLDKSIAPIFDATISYAVDDLVMYQDKLYKCTTAHTGAWDAADFTPSSVDIGASGFANNAGAHNSVYRGKSLGTSVTARQYAAIQAGTFENLFIGDFWTINGIVYRIAAFDYWLKIGGSTGATDHHVVLVPDDPLYNAKMNDTNTTSGGYVGSKMYTTYLDDAKSTINAAFGSSHILTHRAYLVNAIAENFVNKGFPFSRIWCDSTVDLMNEYMVYGGFEFEPANGVTGSANSNKKGASDATQLPLFFHEPSRIANGTFWWLRTNVDLQKFAAVRAAGNSSKIDAGNPEGVRPAFAIYSPTS